MGGYSLGATWGDNAQNTVLLNISGNLGDNQGTVVIGKATAFLVSQETGVSGKTKQFKVDNNGNICIAQMTPGTSATNTLVQGSGTAPSTSPVDAFQMYSNDIVAGNAAPHFRTENGGIVKIYQQTTAVAAATFVANTSGIANDTATFDGYTIGQVVRALRNSGLLQ